MTFFEIQTPKDMLEKAQREFARLEQDLNIDNVFNFFVTANHIADYIKHSNMVPPESLQAFLKDPDIKMARDVCDKAKHMRLTYRPDPLAETWKVGMPETKFWILTSGRHQVGIKLLALNTLTKWSDFFSKHPALNAS